MKLFQRCYWFGVVLGVSLPMFQAGAAASSSEVQRWVDAIRSVGKEGQGNPEASDALQQLSRQSQDALVPVLSGMKDASVLAQNWIRSAVESIVHRARTEQQDLSVMPLTEFLLDESQDPRARSLAFELIQAEDAETAEVLLRGLINDPSNDLRYQAVAQWIEAGNQALAEDRPEGAKVLFRQALQYAREIEQIRTLATSLEKMDYPVDIPQLLGFITDWKVIGPFPNLGRTGFATAFPPEASLDWDARYQGKSGEVTWGTLSSDDRFGMVDINQAYSGYLKEVTAYAYHAFESDSDREVQIRLGCKNAWKIWLNGTFIFGRDEYHRGAKIDQYILDVPLRQGRNDLLVKLCQNEQVEDWTVEWEFQLRVCDSTGKPIYSAVGQ